MKPKLLSDLGPTFFDLSTDYRKTQLDQILFLVKRGFSYRDILTMPIYLRTYYVNYMIDLENEK